MVLTMKPRNNMANSQSNTNKVVLTATDCADLAGGCDDNTLLTVASSNNKNAKKPKNGKNGKKGGQQDDCGSKGKSMTCGTNRCKVCIVEFDSTDDCLGCFSCGCWLHVSCTGMSSAQYSTILSLGDCVEYFCPSCANCKSAVNLGSGDQVAASKPGDGTVADRLSKLEGTVLSLVETLKESSALCRDAPSSTQSNEEPRKYSDIVRALSNAPEGVKWKTNASTVEPSKRAKHVLHLLGASTNCLLDRKEFICRMCQFFPGCKFVSAYKRPSGTVLLFFHDAKSKQRVIDEWSSTYFGTNTRVADPLNKPPNLSVVAKNIPLDLTEAEMLNDLKNVFASCERVTRFQRNGERLPVIKVDFIDVKDKDKIVEEGCFFKNVFIPVNEYIHVSKPIRCYHCQKFGHVSSACKHGVACVKCSGGHKHAECHTDAIRCTNCSGNHFASDTRCPFFLEMARKLNLR
jgi:hypothetical protein